MEFPFSRLFFPFGGERQLKDAAGHLASLKEDELRAAGDVLSQLEVPIDAQKIKVVGRRIQEKVGRLSADEWETIVGLILQFLSVPDFMAMLEDLEFIDDQGRAQLRKALDSLKSNQVLKRVIATDKLLERGPRLKQMNWFCDIRTQFSDSGEAKAGTDTHVAQEEIKLPIVIVRMAIDEVESPVYFQLTVSELEEHISKLQKARNQLRHLIEKERM